MGRLAAVLVLSTAYLALTGHCELSATVAPPQKQGHSCCTKDGSADATPAKNGKESGGECCKSFHPTVISADKKTANPDWSFVPHSYFSAAVVFPEALPLADKAELDTGPPFASTFAEAVLQRSLLAHAPPTLI